MPTEHKKTKDPYDVHYLHDITEDWLISMGWGGVWSSHSPAESGICGWGILVRRKWKCLANPNTDWYPWGPRQVEEWLCLGSWRERQVRCWGVKGPGFGLQGEHWSGSSFGKKLIRRVVNAKDRQPDRQTTRQRAAWVGLRWEFCPITLIVHVFGSVLSYF